VGSVHFYFRCVFVSLPVGLQKYEISGKLDCKIPKLRRRALYFRRPGRSVGPQRSADGRAKRETDMERITEGIDEKFMRQALDEARRALAREEVPIGAVVVAGDRVVGRGHNLVETLQDATAHAEMQAITAAASTLGGKYLRECTLYVTVEPCVMCAGAIAWSQIGRLVYGASDPKRGYTTVDGLRLHPRTSVSSGVLQSECETLMRAFFGGLRDFLH